MLRRIAVWSGFFLFAVSILVFASPEHVSAFLIEHGSIIGMHPILFAFGFFVAYAVAFALTIPVTTVLAVTIGFGFGFLHGFAVTMLATLLGACTIFLLARKFDFTFSKRLLDSSYAVLLDEARLHPISFLLGTRFAPLVPYPIAHVIPAKAGVQLRDFFFTTLLGTFPATAVFVAFGSQVRAVAHHGSFSMLPFTIGLIGLSILILVPLTLRRFKVLTKRE